MFDTLIPLRIKVQHLEAKMEYLEEHFPRKPLGEEFEEIQSSIEPHADLEQFKERMRRGLLELRETIASVDARLNIRAPDHGCALGSCVGKSGI